MNNDVLVEMLTELRAVIAAGWCQGAPALDQFGNSISFQSDKACEFCLLGGTFRINDSRTVDPALLEILRVGATQVDGESKVGEDRGDRSWLAAWNDTRGRTKSQVLRAIDVAIRMVSNATQQ
jgi:hypothetical protein